LLAEENGGGGGSDLERRDGRSTDGLGDAASEVGVDGGAANERRVRKTMEEQEGGGE
jgi:hypothetical protein